MYPHVDGDPGDVSDQLAPADTSGDWPGTYGERLRTLLARHATAVDAVLDEHDRLVSGSAAQPDRFVVTHREPHPCNLMHTPGGLVLIDWETALLAPPEGDVWLLDPGLLSRYRLAWALADVAHFVDLLRHTSDETDDTAWSWNALRGTLEDLSGAMEEA